MPADSKNSKMFVVKPAATPTSPAGDTPYASNRKQDKREPGYRRYFDTPVRLSDDTCASFNEGEWFFPHTNTSNQSGYLRVRVPPALLDYFEQVIGSQHFPYKTVEDLYRHGLERHARFLHSLDPDLEDDLYSAFLNIQKTLKRAALRSQAEENAAAALKELKELVAKGIIGEAKELADSLTGRLKRCRPGPFHDELAAMLESHIGQITKQIEERFAPMKAQWEAKRAEREAQKLAEEEAEAEAIAVAAAAAPAPAPTAKRRPKSYTENVLDESDYKVRTYGPPPELE